MENIIRELEKKAMACSNSTKESRARKGAYVDAIVMMKEALRKPAVIISVCPSCGADWDMTKHNACECGASIKR